MLTQRQHKNTKVLLFLFVGSVTVEIIIVIIIILVICLILDVNYLLLASAILICVFAGALTLGFVYCSVGLLFSKRKEAKFLRIDRHKSAKFQVAYYLVEGKEYPCIFPKEGILENKLYRKDKTYHVMLNKKMQRVYDRFAIATCVLGLVFSVGLSMGIIFLIH